jgi:hypothetical protein
MESKVGKTKSWTWITADYNSYNNRTESAGSQSAESAGSE